MSVAAGVRIESLESALPAGTAVVRGMPNLPASVGQGCAGLSRGNAVDDVQFADTLKLFGQVGTTFSLEEAQIDAFTAIAGSGPGLVYYLVEQFTKAYRDAGLDDADAVRVTGAIFRSALQDFEAIPAPGPVEATSGPEARAIIAEALIAARDRGQAIAAQASTG